MKSIIAIIIFLMSTTAHTAIISRHYICGPGQNQTGGLTEDLVFEIREQLVSAGPLLPSYDRRLELVLVPHKPNQTPKRYPLVFKEISDDIQRHEIFQAVESDGTPTGYDVFIEDDRATIRHEETDKWWDCPLQKLVDPEAASLAIHAIMMKLAQTMWVGAWAPDAGVPIVREQLGNDDGTVINLVEIRLSFKGPMLKERLHQYLVIVQAGHVASVKQCGSRSALRSGPLECY